MGTSAEAKLSFVHVSSQRAGGQRQRLRTLAAAAVRTPEEREVNSASLEQRDERDMNDSSRLMLMSR